MVQLCASLRRGERGWLLRWTEGEAHYYCDRRRRSFWTPDHEEAVALRARLRVPGTTLDDALKAAHACA